MIFDMDAVPDPRKDPKWLLLPLDRRNRALRRLEALLAYERLTNPGVADVRKLADEAGVSFRSFYALLKAWRQPGGRTVWTLVPYAQRRTPPKSQLEAEVESALHDRIRGAIASGKRTPRAILASIIENWPTDLTMPSHQTVRAHIDSAGGMDIIERGPFRLNTSLAAQEEAETATEHGEVLVVDHCAADVFLDEDPPRRLTLTLAIDLFTATIAGFAVGTGKPRAAAVLEALDDAARRSASHKGDPVRPRILLAVDDRVEWRRLLGDLAVRHLKATVRWSTRLHSGGPTRRLIGMKIADLPISPRKAHDASGGSDRFAPSKHPLLSRSEAEHLLKVAIERMNSERLTHDTLLHKLDLGSSPGTGGRPRS